MTIKVNAMSYARLISLLMHGDMTMRELAEETGLHYTTVRDYCTELHKAHAIHIARYDPDTHNRHSVKVYKLGKGKDATRPRMSGAERQARRRMKQKMIAHPLLQLALIRQRPLPSRRSSESPGPASRPARTTTPRYRSPGEQASP